MSIPPFSELLGKCRSSAVHLECATTTAPTETRSLAAWRTRELEDHAAWWRPFHDNIASAVSRGVVVRRARVVSEPVSEYIRWEHYVTRANQIAGEEVRWLPRRQTTDVPMPGNDFWLFDGTLLRVHHFAGDGSLVKDELTDDAKALKLCASAFEEIWKRATPHDRYSV